MKTFIAKAEAYQTISKIEDDRKIGFYYLDDVIVEIEAKSIEEAKAADLKDWTVIDESGGYDEVKEAYDFYEVDYGIPIIEDVWEIEEE